MRKKAFTLAEVLIALVVIGIIAAITVPSLIQSTNKQEYATALQKAYSTLTQVTNQIISEEGSPKADEGGWASTGKNAAGLFKKYLNNAKECIGSSGCFPQGGYKALDGADSQNYNSSMSSLILADGMQAYFTPISGYGKNLDCSYDVHGSNDICMGIFVDINGAKKPNIWGRDLFIFMIKENGLFPAGCDYEGACLKSDGSKGAGTGCACKVLREGAMNY